MKIKANIALEELFSYHETGYLKGVLDQLVNSQALNDCSVYIYFKRTQEQWRLDESDIDSATILIVIIDENDHLPNGINLGAKAIFKTYLRKSDKSNHIYHLPVGFKQFNTVIRQKPINERSINVFFSGNLHIGRKLFYKSFVNTGSLPFPIVHRLRWIFGTDFSSRFKRSYINFTSKFANGLSVQEYLQKMANSKIVLCPPGNPGNETIRHYEALRLGCIVISEKLPNCNCFNDAPIIIIDSWAKLKGIIDDLLSNSQKLEEIHLKTLAWWKNKCSTRATAQYIIKTVRGLN